MSKPYTIYIELELSEEQMEFLQKHGGNVLAHCCLPANAQEICEDIQRMIVMQINSQLEESD